jgi:hypothetical protein
MTKDSAKESGTSAKTVERWVWPSQKETTLKNEGKESETLTNQAPTQFDSGHGGARKGAGRKRDDFNAIFDTEERLSGELDELNKKKSDVLKELKEILYNRDDKVKELKQLNELIEKEKEMFPKEYEEYRKH